MTARISTWTLNSDTSGTSRPKLVIAVVDDDFGLSKHFYLFGAGWSTSGERMEPVETKVRDRLDGLVKTHPVLGASSVLVHLKISYKQFGFERAKLIEKVVDVVKGAVPDARDAEDIAAIVVDRLALAGCFSAEVTR